MKRISVILFMLLNAIFALGSNIKIYPVTFDVPYLSSTMNQIQLVNSNQGLSFICGYNTSCSSPDSLKSQLNTSLDNAEISFARVSSVSGYWQGGSTSIQLFMDPLSEDEDVRILRISTNTNDFDICMVREEDGILDTFSLVGKWSETAKDDFNLQLSGSQYGVTYRLLHNGHNTITVTGTGKSIDFGTFLGTESHGRYSVIASYMNWDTQNAGSITMENRYSFSNNHNYIAKHTFTSELGQSWYTDVTYYDGLGNPSQEISLKASSMNKNMVRPIVYDCMMRPDSISFLPYAGISVSGLFVEDAISQQNNYHLDDYAYSNTYYDAAGRKTSYVMPGMINKMLGKKQSAIYRINDGSEMVRKLTYSYPSSDSNSSVVTEGYYGENELMMTETISEDNDTTQVFQDNFGKSILSRQLCDGINHDTYYVYDMRDSLVCVIQPKGSASMPQQFNFDDGFAKQVCFTYMYDSRGNLIEKSVPEKGMEEMYYDLRNRMVMYSNTLLNSIGKYGYYIYDELDRLQEEGYASCSIDKNELRDYLKTETQIDNVLTDKIITKTVSFYDSEADYPSGFSWPVEAHRNHISYDYCKTLPATETLYEVPTIDGNYIGRLVSDSLLTRHFFYDNHGRIGHIADRGEDRWDGHRTYVYDFSGNVVEDIEEHAIGAGNMDWIVRTYGYDTRGRKTRLDRSVNDIALNSIEYFYDDFGRLVYKTIGDSGTEEYSYNTQGWQTSRTAMFHGDPVFIQTMRYQEPTRSSSAARYGGYISELSYTQFGQSSKTLSFYYDRIGRLTDTKKFIGDTSISRDIWVDKDIEYDLNGNIISYTQYMQSGISIPIINTYAGNRLTSTRIGNNYYQYDYYNNGNIKRDRSKGLYFYHNLINLPTYVKTTADQPKQRFTYLADGTKLRTRDNWQIGFNYRGSFVYELLDDGTERLDNIGYDEGLIIGTTRDNNSFHTQFFDTWHVKDHLGNIRAVIDISGDANGIQPALIEQNDFTPLGRRESSASLVYDVTNRYRFNGKEDQTVGALKLYDYGARYYDYTSARWTTPDPLAEKYYSTSPYVFCANNPINLIDPDGMDIRLAGINNSSITIFTPLFNSVVDLSPFGVDWHGNYVFDGQEALQYGLDLVGFFDPTGVADAMNASIYASGGDWKNATISAVSLLPLGDVLKAKRIGGAVEYFLNGVRLKKHKHHIVPKAVYRQYPELAEYMHRDNGNLFDLPEKFHGNHPAYSKWIEMQIIEHQKTLSKETIQKITNDAKKEIKKAEKVWLKSNGAINMNEYFKKKNGKN